MRSGGMGTVEGEEGVVVAARVDANEGHSRAGLTAHGEQLPVTGNMWGTCIAHSPGVH